MVGTLVKPISGSILHPGHPLARGLDVFWAMTEGAGQVLHNAAGPQYAATASGTPTWDTCSRFPGRALRFDGVDDYFDFGNVLAIRTRDVSMMALVQLDAVQAETYGVVCGRGAIYYGAKGAVFYVKTNKLGFQIRGSAAVGVPGLDSLLDTGWHVAIATVDRDSATGVRHYIDGVLQGTADPSAFASADIYDSTDHFAIGAEWQASSFLCDFRGVIAAVAQWHRALSAAEVAELSRDPFCVLRRPASRAWLGAMSAGGTNHALIGSVSAAASVLGALSIARPLTGSANAAAAAVGTLSIAKRVAGSTAGQSLLSGSLGVARTLVGQIAAQPQVAASVVVARSLAGQIAGQSSMSGTLSTQGQVSLSGSISAASSAGGSLSATRSLDGHVTATAVAAASLSRTIALSGRVEAATSLSAAGSIVRSLAGGIDATASLAASAAVDRSLSGSIAASASLSGSLLTPGGGSVTAIFLMLKKRR
jgi:hypothetical protein